MAGRERELREDFALPRLARLATDGLRDRANAEGPSEEAEALLLPGRDRRFLVDAAARAAEGARWAVIFMQDSLSSPAATVILLTSLGSKTDDPLSCGDSSSCSNADEAPRKGDMTAAECVARVGVREYDETWFGTSLSGEPW